MEKVVVDTSSIIQYLKRGDRTLHELINQQEKGLVKLYISSLTLFEFFVGLDRKNLDKLEIVSDLFNYMEILDIDEHIAKRAGGLAFDHKILQSIDALDILIGATALELGAKIYTLNKKHFKLIPGLELL